MPALLVGFDAGQFSASMPRGQDVVLVFFVVVRYMVCFASLPAKAKSNVSVLATVWAMTDPRGPDRRPYHLAGRL